MKTLLVAAMFTAMGVESAAADCGCGAWLLAESVAEGTPAIVLATSCAAKFPNLAIEDAAGKSTKVTLIAKHEGYGGTQYVFQPERALGPGKHTVKITSRYETTKHVLDVVAATAKASTPSWSSSPSVTAQSQAELGCGPAKSVKVSAGSAASLAYVELIDDGSKRRSTGYVRVQHGELSIGHGMCSGAFSLTKSRDYTATITLLAPERGTTSTSRTVSFTYSP
jgi:hypothetical protein